MNNTPFAWLVDKTIVFVGDSITADGRANYVSLFVSGVSGHVDATKIKVVNSGVDSSSVLDALDRFPDIVVEHDPDVCVFFLGVNDSKIIRGTDKPLVRVDVFKENYMHLLDAATYKRNRTVALMTIPPLLFAEIKASPLLRDYWYWIPEDYEGYNAVIRELAQSKGCVLVDVAAYFQQDTHPRLFTPDGVHPNIYGHRIIANILMEMMEHSRG